MQETQVWSLGWEEPLEEGMATHSSILAWRIPWTEGLEGYSPDGHKESEYYPAIILKESIANTHNYKDESKKHYIK